MFYIFFHKILKDVVVQSKYKRIYTFEISKDLGARLHGEIFRDSLRSYKITFSDLTNARNGMNLPPRSSCDLNVGSFEDQLMRCLCIRINYPQIILKYVFTFRINELLNCYNILYK